MGYGVYQKGRKLSNLVVREPRQARSRPRSGVLGEGAVCNPPDLRSGLHIGCEDHFTIYEQAQQLSSDLILHCGHHVLNGGAYLQAPNADRRNCFSSTVMNFLLDCFGCALLSSCYLLWL